jgi:hypothetical protein
MECVKPLSSLGPGDKFTYREVSYIMVDFKISECFISAVMPELICALNLDNYKIECLDGKEEVEVVYYYGGL